MHKKFITPCPSQVALVDQYMWAEKDENVYLCQNGVSYPIYDVNGDISYTLPLEMYPPVNEIHEQIRPSRRHLHFGQRYNKEQYVHSYMTDRQREQQNRQYQSYHEQMLKDAERRRHEAEDLREKRIEGFYSSIYPGSVPIEEIDAQTGQFI